MKIIVAGDWHSELHEEVVSNALKNLGHEVEEFKWHHYFKIEKSRLYYIKNCIARFQNKYIFGMTIKAINIDLIRLALGYKPEMIFIYRGTHITAKSIRAIKNALPNCIIIGYNNDDPFSPTQVDYLWRHFLSALNEYDLILAYRHCNIIEYQKAGARRVELLRSWFVPERNHPVALKVEELNQFQADVVFIGHYEIDQRLEFLEEIVRQGFNLRLFGPGYDWDPVIRKSKILKSLEPVQLVWGEDYNKALCGAKIALCFFSKLNRDTYTRRCFEIPATQTLLLSEYSEDIATIYNEGIEAEFFKSRDEMIEKIRINLADDNRRISIATAGYRRVHSSEHDVTSRMKQVLKWVVSIHSENNKI